MGTGAKSGSAKGDEGPLTRRELDVLALVATGERSRDIAGRLGVSEATVKRHLYNLYRKLGVTNRVGAMMWYVSHLQEGEGSAPKAARGRRR